MNRQVIYYRGHRYTRRTYKFTEHNRPGTGVIAWRHDRRLGHPFPVMVSERYFLGAPFRLTPDDAGCWVDGHWGQYGVAHMVNRAQELGYDDAEVIALADRHIADISLRGTDPLSTDEYWILSEASDDVEEWLNEHVAPEGYYFGWNDGEFFLQSDEWWEESP